MKGHFSEFKSKMELAGVNRTAIEAFRHQYDTLLEGRTGLIPESEIDPIASLPDLETVATSARGRPALLSETVVVKLNGGLGTSMGLERAKSLLPVKNGLTFLDFIVKQVLWLRELHGVAPRFLLMNSFSTSEDTREFLKKYPQLGDPEALELMQNQVPKVDASTLRPVSWRANPQLEWCPPGHGDLYTALAGSGALDRLLAAGVKYMFVSNSDNLGATLDLPLLSWFADSRTPFLMEVARRAASDRKGGHLARRRGNLLLRESAQCPESDMPCFQDIERHRFFNTNSLWIRLDALKALVQRNGGFVPLPLIKNSKTVDPRDNASPKVFQLETAMGAAIECFEGAAAIVVPRARFAPVKTTADLLALRSDAYRVTDDWRIELAAEKPPTIELDSAHYKLVDQLEDKLRAGVPSLLHCTSLKVTGPTLFSSKNIFRGKLEVRNSTEIPEPLPPGEYADQSVDLS